MTDNREKGKGENTEVEKKTLQTKKIKKWYNKHYMNVV